LAGRAGLICLRSRTIRPNHGPKQTSPAQGGPRLENNDQGRDAPPPRSASGPWPNPHPEPGKPARPPENSGPNPGKLPPGQAFPGGQGGRGPVGAKTVETHRAKSRQRPPQEKKNKPLSAASNVGVLPACGREKFTIRAGWFKAKARGKKKPDARSGKSRLKHGEGRFFAALQTKARRARRAPKALAANAFRLPGKRPPATWVGSPMAPPGPGGRPGHMGQSVPPGGGGAARPSGRPSS